MDGSNCTIRWIPYPDVEGGSWAALDDDDGSVLDRFDTLEEAQSGYPQAWVIR